MAEETREKNKLPESLKDHVMASKYEYNNYDEATGIWKPTGGGDFMIKRPHASFAITTFFNRDHDPFPTFEEVTMDEGDFLLVTPQKTGTHLVHEILRMLITGKAEYHKGSKDDVWIEIQPYEKILKSQAKPRIINTHLALSWLPASFRRPDTKTVITMRNIKDTFVSYFCHEMSNLGIYDDQTRRSRWPEFFRYLLYCKTVSWTSFFEMFADTWDNYRNDPNVLIVFFEDVKEVMRDTVEKIAAHLGISYTQDLVGQILEACNIDKMREVKGKIEHNFFYRKGQVGDWKNWFTVAQNEEFHKVYDEWNKERQIPFNFG